MNPKILNREFKHPADGWYHIEPKGTHPNRGSQVVQVIDDEACDSIVNRFNADATAGKLSHGSEMLIDHEHFKHDADKETRAYGWLQQLQNRADGVYGQIHWSDTGKKAVDGGDYRFFSTEYDPADLKVLNSKTKTVRPLRLDGLTLTNDPNNKGGKPITNRNEPMQTITTPAQAARLAKKILNKVPEPEAGGEASPEAVASRKAAKATVGADDKVGHMKAAAAHLNAASQQKTAGNDDLADMHAALAQHHLDACEDCDDGEKNTPSDETKTKNEKMKNIATKLGLPAEADEQSILAGITKLINRTKELETETVASLLDSRRVTDEKIRNRLTPVLAGLATREERIATLDDLGFKATATAANQGRVLNRGTGKSQEAVAETGGAEDDQAIAKKITNRANELRGAAPGRKFDDCWQQAVRELQAA